jgi:hypothetical protein
MLAKRKRSYRRPTVDMSRRKSLESLLCYYSSKNPIPLLSYTQGSGKICYWNHIADDCGCIHEWAAQISNMTTPSNTIGCGKCHGRGGDTPCCDKKSLVGNERFQQIKDEWNDTSSPSMYYPLSHHKVSWRHVSNICGCTHIWDCEIYNRIGNGVNCSQCSRVGGKSPPCCNVGTVSSDPRLMKEWDFVKNTLLGLDPTKLYLGSGIKAHWKCENTCQGQLDCKHEWVAEICNRKKTNCPHCASQTMIPCCKNRSLASDIYANILLQLDFDENKNIDPRLLYPSSNHDLDWVCRDALCGCVHKWKSSPNQRIIIGSAIPKKGCQYCSFPPRKICCENHPSSLLQWKDKEKLRCIVNDNNSNLALVAIMSCVYLKFNCLTCNHLFIILLSNVTRTNAPSWCHFCSRNRVCGSPTCTTCKMKCQMGTCSKVARRQTKITRVWYCDSCLLDCIQRNPQETPLINRAKVSLEIYILCEIQRLDTCGIWSIPTTWDCAVLYGLNFKPDMIFIFDENNSLYETCGACKINSREIGYILQVEIIEESRKTHSLARNPSDSQRELEIRQTFHGIPIGMLYITVAHVKHLYAHQDDVFFHKVDQEYQLLPDRVEAFQIRAQQVLDTLFDMFENHEDGTRFIGH